MPSSSGSLSPLLPHRDRIAILSALIGVIVLAWAYVIYLSAQMLEMDADAAAVMLSLHSWMPVDFVFMLRMRAIMMVGMMLPSVIPMALIYADMIRKAEGQGMFMVSTTALVFGYLTMWCLFSLGATLAQ